MTDFSKLEPPEYYKTNRYPQEIEEGGSIYGLYEDHLEWWEENKKLTQKIKGE